VIQQLDLHFGVRKPAKSRHAKLDIFKTEVETILALIAFVEHKDDAMAKAAFTSGASETGVPDLYMPARQDFRLEMLNRSLDNLMQLRPLVKPRLLKACVAVILQDGKAVTQGLGLVRTISTCLDCPMPPVLR